jgi:hypothetical protein
MKIQGQKRLAAESASGDLFVRNIVSYGAIVAPALHTLERFHGWSGANWVGMVVWGRLKERAPWNHIV